KVEFRSDKLAFATVKGKDLEFSTQMVWSPDAKNLVIHGQGLANEGEGFDNTALFNLALKKMQVWQQHVPLYIAGSPIRPDGAGFLLVIAPTRDDSSPEYAWVDWTGKKQTIEMAKRSPGEEGLSPWTALFDSRWDGDRATITSGRRRYVIDTKKLQETIKVIA